MLRELRAALGRDGLSPKDRRTPAEEEARVAAFVVLGEFAHLLDQFRRAVEGGKPCHLVVREHGRQLGKVVVEIAIEEPSA